MSCGRFLSTGLVCVSLVVGAVVTNAGQTPEPAQPERAASPAPPRSPARSIGSASGRELVLMELQAVERRARVDTICIVPGAAPAPVLAVTSFAK
jgi:hypothetical protein